MLQNVKEKVKDHFIPFYDTIKQEIIHESICHPFGLDNPDVDIKTTIPIVMITNTEIYCVYPVQNMDRLFTEKLIIKMYVDKIILSDCIREDITYLPAKLKIDKKIMRPYLFSVSDGTYREISIDNDQLGRDILTSGITSKYERFFEKMFLMYESDYKSFNTKKENIQRQVWLKNIFASAINDAEDDEAWSKDKFIKKCKAKLASKVLPNLYSTS